MMPLLLLLRAAKVDRELLQPLKDFRLLRDQAVGLLLVHEIREDVKDFRLLGDNRGDRVPAKRKWSKWLFTAGRPTCWDTLRGGCWIAGGRLRGGCWIDGGGESGC